MGGHILDKVARKCISEDKVPEKKPERNKGANHANTFQAETITNSIVLSGE